MAAFYRYWCLPNSQIGCFIDPTCSTPRRSLMRDGLVFRFAFSGVVDFTSSFTMNTSVVLNRTLWLNEAPLCVVLLEWECLQYQAAVCNARAQGNRRRGMLWITQD